MRDLTDLEHSAQRAVPDWAGRLRIGLVVLVGAVVAWRRHTGDA